MREIGMKTYLHDPIDAAKNLKLRFRVGDLDLPEEEKYVPVVERRRKTMHRSVPVAKQWRAEPIKWWNVNYTRRNGTC